MLKKLRVWIFSFIGTFIFIVTYHKLIGSMVIGSRRAYKWDEIVDELPGFIFFSIFIAFGLLHAYNQDRKDQGGE